MSSDVRSLIYVEIDIAYCSLTYGVSPCAASIGVTGDIKCFNALNTCQDRNNFATSTVTLRFHKKSVDYALPEVDSIGSLIDATFEPGKVSLGDDLGIRTSVNIEFEDHPHGDRGQGFDKYATERTYDAFSQGTFWGKFRARQPFLRGRDIRIKRGFVGQDFADFETRHYVIESFNGPTPDGRYTLVAKDPLKLADGDRAQAPNVSRGSLLGGITAGATAATLTPTGIGNAEYPASGYVAIGGNEICSFTRSGDLLTLGRGFFNTGAQAHAAQDRVQLVLVYDGVDPGDIIRDLLINYAGVPSSYIDQAAWNDETNAFLARLYTGVIAEPTAVKDVVIEIIKQAGLVVWWADEAQKVRLQVLRGVPSDAAEINESNMLAGSLNIREQPSKRLSQVWTRFGLIDPLKGLDDDDNYRSVEAAIDTDKEADYGSAAIEKIDSRWIPVGGRPVAATLNDIRLARFSDPPRRLDFSLFRTGPITPLEGQGYRLAGTWLQDETGAPVTAPIQVTRVNKLEDRYDVQAEEMLYVAPAGLGNRIVVIDTNQQNLNLRTLHDQLYPDPTGSETVIFIQEPTAIISSISNGLPAFNVGSWPGGVDLILQLKGRMQGAGGRGGNGGQRGALNGLPGLPGGIALLTGVPIKLDTSLAELWGGGGGGGGSGGYFDASQNTAHGGNGGGGGAGINAGSGGLKGADENALTEPQNGSPGSSTAGGQFGLGNSGVTQRAGAGGGPGLAGQSGLPGVPAVGQGDGPGNGGASGAAGAAISGVSNVTFGTWDGATFTAGPAGGDIRGPQVG